MTTLPTVTAPPIDCWNRIGVRGDRSCPELEKVTHCHNCPVFANAGRQFLNAPAPDEYVEEWTKRLAAPPVEAVSDLQSVLVFRVATEWLALPVRILIEVALPRPVHRIPHRGGLLAGLVNVRGELQLCVHLGQLLGLRAEEESAPPQPARLLVTQRESDRWVFPVDEVDQVHRIPTSDLTPVPATVARSSARLTRGVFTVQGRSVGYLDDLSLFHALRVRVR